jgi:hypothetical protein
MKLSTLLLPVLAAVAYAAPVNERDDPAPLGDAGGSLNELFRVENGVVIGPGGYFDKNGFHPEEYKGQQGKRDAYTAPEHEERDVEERVWLGPAFRVFGPRWRVRYGVLIGPNAWWGPSGFHYGRYPYGPYYRWW